MGTLVTIVGSGLPPMAAFSVYNDHPDQTTYVASPARLTGPQTDSNGALRVDIYMPFSAYGQHSICVDAGSARACAPFAVEPAITLTVNSGPPGTPLWMSGSGFPAGEVVALYFDIPQLHLSTPGPVADAQGSFQAQPTRIPFGSSDGVHVICGDTGATGGTQPVVVKTCANFEVVNIPARDQKVSVTVDPAPEGGVRLTVTGSGFPPFVPMGGSTDGTLLAMPRTVIGPLELDTDQQGAFLWPTFTLAFEYYDSLGHPIALSNGRHEFCAFTVPVETASACGQFAIQGAPSAIPPSSARATPSPSPNPIVIAAQDTANRLPIPVRLIGLAILILLAFGAVAWLKISKSRARGVLP